MKNNKGFTLIIAITTTSLLLIVSFAVSNIALKQLVLAHAAQESQFSFYNADSGTECAIYWDLKNLYSAFDPYRTASDVTCNGQSVPQTRVIGATYATSTITFNLTKGCVVVDVVKRMGVATTTKIDSRGYNTCDVGASRKYERAVTISYD
ncbi:MAG: hypothetical protein ABL917_00275 [Parcubacteria group bacterium]